MGYSHKYYRVAEFDRKQFLKVKKDFERIITPLEHLGVKL